MAGVRRRPDELDPTGAGPADIPFDRSDPPDMGASPAGGGAGMSPIDAMMGTPPGGGGLADLGTAMAPTQGAPAQLGGELTGDPELDAMIAALEDPNTPPEIKAQIQAELEQAAREMMAGGGVG